MQCLLVSALDPWQKGTRPLMTPLGLAYLAGALLKQGHQIKILQRELEYIKTRFNVDQVNKNMIKLAQELKPHVV